MQVRKERLRWCVSNLNVVLASIAAQHVWTAQRIACGKPVLANELLPLSAMYVRSAREAIEAEMMLDSTLLLLSTARARSELLGPLALEQYEADLAAADHKLANAPHDLYLATTTLRLLRDYANALLLAIWRRYPAAI